MSYYNEDDFYSEPSEFEMQIEEFKESLRNSVKENYKAELERLRKENEELQEVKMKFEAIQQDYREKEQQLRYDRDNMERKLRGVRLSELMKDLDVTLFKAHYDYLTEPKCGECNEKRQILFKSPSGKQMVESCQCANKTIHYLPSEQILKEFRKRDFSGLPMIAWYRQYKDGDDGYVLDSSTVMKTLYSPEMNFADLNRHDTFFRTHEECQKYCDWLNEKEKEGAPK